MSLLMRERLRSSGLTVTVTMLYMLVALAVGFLHVGRAPVSADDIAFRSALAFARSLSAAGVGDQIFCVQEDGSGGSAMPRVCDACLLTSAPGLAADPADRLLVPEEGHAVLESAVLPASVPAPRPRPASRGPPAISLPA